MGSVPLLCGALLTLSEPKSPVPVTVNKLLGEAYSGPKHVSLEGELYPDFTLMAQPAKDSGETKNTYVALLDHASKAAILVEVTDATQDRTQSGPVHVHGTLQFTDIGDTHLYAHIPDTIADLPAVRKYYLNENATPDSPLLLGVIGGTVGIVFVLYLVAGASNWTIFMKSAGEKEGADVTTPLPAQAPMDIRLSGRLGLAPNVQQRFQEVPCWVQQTPTNDFVFLSNIDASVKSSIYMIPTGTTERRGTWHALFPPSPLLELETGELFYGAGSRPALRIRCRAVTVPTPAPHHEPIILTFATREQRAIIMSFLSQSTPPSA